MSELAIQTAVVGDVEIKRNFSDFGSDTRVRVRRVLAESGRALSDLAASKAPRKTGTLASKIHPRQKESNNTITETVVIPTKPGIWMEFGTVNHGTLHNHARLGGKLTKVQRVRGLRASGSYRIKPHPFVGPTMEELRPQIDADLREALGAAVVEANR
jgi:hypothetical protein